MLEEQRDKLEKDMNERFEQMPTAGASRSPTLLPGRGRGGRPSNVKTRNSML